MIRKMTTFQKLIALFLFVITLSSIYYFFVFLPEKKETEQKRIEQIKADCYEDIMARLKLARDFADAIDPSAPFVDVPTSKMNQIYNFCLHEHGL